MGVVMTASEERGAAKGHRADDAQANRRAGSSARSAGQRQVAPQAL